MDVAWLVPVDGRIMAHGPLNIPIPARSDCAAFHGRRDFTDVEDPEMGVLDFPGLSWRVFTRGRQAQRGEVIWGAQNWGQSLETWEGWGRSPQSLQEERLGWHPDAGLWRPILDFCLSALQDHMSVLFQATQFTMTCRNSSRKRIRWSGGA